MDFVADAANSVVRSSIAAAGVAAEELAKQANSLATAKDPLSWLAGEDADDDEDLDGLQDEPPPPAPVPTPLSVLEPWGGGWAGSEAAAASAPRLRFAPAAAAAAAAASSHGSGGAAFDDGDWFAEDAEALGVLGGPGAGGASPSRPPRSAVPFAVDFEANSKLVLWEGDICCLDVDALLVPAAAGFVAGASGTFPRVSRFGGRDLRADLKHMESCRSGEARLTKAYNLPSRWLLLTVGPKYKEKFKVAAQNTLNACYRECFQALAEAQLRTVAIPCLWYHKSYPIEEHVHVALRTVRRCLEKMSHALDSVVFVASGPAEFDLYERLLPLYFPRTEREAQAASQADLDGAWSQWGELAVEERRIRVASHLVGRRGSDDCAGGGSAAHAGGGGGDDDDDGDEDQDPLFVPGDDGSFLNARSDADSAAVRRLEGTMTEAETSEAAAQACLRYLRRAKEIRAEPEATRFVYRAPGRDRFRRRVVVLLGARLPDLGVRDERTLPLFVKELELLMGERFILLYVNSEVSALDNGKLEVLHEMLAVVSARYRTFLDQLFVLHPGLGFRAAFALGRAVSDHAASVWSDTVYLEGMLDLTSHFSLQQLGLPAYVRASEEQV